MEKQGVKLVLQWECDRIRRKVAERLGSVRLPVDDKERWRLDGIAEFGVTEVVAASGRAVCRCCGQKIGKGEVAIKFPFDFTGAGAWTGVEVQIHGEACSAWDSNMTNQAPFR